jgi:hypothetical protein
MRRIEAMRDRIMTMCGTSEPLIPVGAEGFPPGHQPISLQWRKPLSIEEVNRLAPTQEVRERRGRP